MPWIFAHLIGDYLLQNDWMAARKKENSLVCLIHIVTYMLPFMAPWPIILTDNIIHILWIAVVVTYL